VNVIETLAKVFVTYLLFVIAFGLLTSLVVGMAGKRMADAFERVFLVLMYITLVLGVLFLFVLLVFLVWRTIWGM
jgi:Na+-driven multidrug efflux pump